MEICVSVYTNKNYDGHASIYQAFMHQQCKVLSIYEPRNPDYSKRDRTYVTYPITLHRPKTWGLAKPWRVDQPIPLPDGWMYEHGPDVFVHSYELKIDDALVHRLCDAFGAPVHIVYKHAPDIGHSHAKVTMSCPIMAYAVVQVHNGFIHKNKCIFVNFNRFPFTECT